MDQEKQLEDLIRRIEQLSVQQEANRIELHQLKIELQKLRLSIESNPEKRSLIQENILSENEIKIQKPQAQQQPATRMIKIISSSSDDKSPKKPSVKRDNQFWEEFVGTNLISKIGIIVLVIGISIGAKYAIDHNLIGPAMRIAVGFLFSFILIGIGVFLKKKYKSFSAVLVGGGLAACYYLVFVSFSYYNFFSNGIAFALMFVLTLSSVAIALWYDLVVVAHIAMVGAYSIPYLLSDGTGNPIVLFIYIAIINCGILWLAFKKLWNTLFYSSFILTSSIYVGLVVFSLNKIAPISGLLIGTAFYVQFYFMFIIYKLSHRQELNLENIIMILFNNLVFFSVGLVFIYSEEELNKFAGIYSLSHAVINLAFAIVVSRYNQKDNSLLFLMFGLMVAFITIALPIQTSGKWLSFLWSVEGIILLAIGKFYDKSIFEKLAYGVLGLAALIICTYWIRGIFLLPRSLYEYAEIPFANYPFFESVFFSAALLIVYRIIYFSGKTKPTNSFISEVLVPIITALSLFLTIRVEIVNWFEQIILKENTNVDAILSGFLYSGNSINFHLGQVILTIFSLFFFVLLFVLNRKWIKNKVVDLSLFVVLLITVIVYLIGGGYHLIVLQNVYIHPEIYQETNFSSGLIYIRYLGLPFVVYFLFNMFSFLKHELVSEKYHNAIRVAFHVLIIGFISSEYLYWMNFFESTRSVKLGLSIIWAAYSLYIIFSGIKEGRKIYRIIGLVFILITLLKLFFIDIAELTSLAKTTVFICLGIIMLVVSYLYNRFKDQILQNEKK